MRWILLGCLLVITGCRPLIPATVPPQLSATPGETITIDDQAIYTDTWQIRYPDGWRVVRINTAADPLQLVFVSPDESMLITIGEAAAADAPPAADQITAQDRLQVGGQTLYLSGSAPASASATFATIYEYVRSSLRLR
jgi:hypothetical protein